MSNGTRAEGVRAGRFASCSRTCRLPPNFEGIDDDKLLKIAEGMQERCYFASPVFDGSKEKEIKALLERAGLPTSGKTFSTTA
jgi:DNA-directed RNA polymerase beta subunit